jgi:hypothetical protein
MKNINQLNKTNPNLMKKNITTLMLLVTFAAFSQQLTYKSGGAVYNGENKKLSPNEVRTLLATNSEALSLYNAGRNKKTWGNVLFYGGLGLVATNLIVSANTDNTTVSSYNSNSYGSPSVHSESANMTAAIIGGALIVASIPIKIGFPKKIKAALDKYNTGLVDNYSPKHQVTLIASAYQFGFRLEF